LVRVLLPATLEPSSTSVWPAPSQGRSSARDSSPSALSATASTPAGRSARAVEPRRHAVAQVGLGQHDERRHSGHAGERDEALEPAKVEVVLQAHHQPGGVVGVSDDDHPFHLVSPVVQPARELVDRRQAFDDPPLAESVARREHSVADRERFGLAVELLAQGRQGAGDARRVAVVRQQVLAVHLEQTGQQRSGRPRVIGVRSGRRGGSAGSRPQGRYALQDDRRAPDGPQPAAKSASNTRQSDS
jgi:hypothetical protein